MRYTKRITASALMVALVVVPLAGCDANSGQADPQQQDNEQKQAIIDYQILVNEQHKLPDGWEDALDLTEEESLLYDDPVLVERKAYEAFKELKDDLAKDDITIEIDSCYRSVANQQEVVEEFIKEHGVEYAKKTVAAPGYSEHHTGLAIDLFLVINGEQVTENEEKEQHPEVWEKVHAKLADHGFILRYPDGKEDITGYPYEPWHIRYVGDSKVAHEIMDKGSTLEEYVGAAEEAKAANAKDAEG